MPTNSRDFPVEQRNGTMCRINRLQRCKQMKELGRLLGYGLGTAAVIALLLSVGSMQNFLTWLLSLVALVLVVVMPIVLGIVLARRAKQRAGTSSNQS